ncbi:MAG: DNA-binding transcriptional regulator [Planctomycetaceae bacterium]|nr:DNA-binding transcriptional regulator [Planctomycetaceae bacterium]
MIQTREKTKVAFAHNNITPNTQGIMAGITEYMRNKGDWQLIVWPDTSIESLQFLKNRGCKGAFVSVQTSTKAQQLIEVGIPIIAVSTLQNMLHLPYISADSEQVAGMAFQYFSKKNFLNFAFYGSTDARWSSERMNYFSQLVARSGRPLHVYNGEQIPVINELIPFTRLWIDTILNRGQQQLIQWLRDLPKPVAVLASCDILACHLCNVADEADLKIPEEVAILGINNDQALCNLCDPPLSSITFNFKKAGLDAARLMDRIISSRESLEGQWIHIQPLYVKSRGSTDSYAIDDPDVVKALKFIGANSSEPLQVDDVAHHVCISKRSLQMKFQKALGRSVHEEIIHAHFEVAKTLLLDTELPIDAISLRSGFHYTTNMRRAFKELTGMLPHKFRAAHQSARFA